MASTFVSAPRRRLKALRPSSSRPAAGRLFGFEISPLSREAQVEALLRPAAKGAGPRLLVTMNLDHVVQLRRTPQFRKAYAGAAVVTLDGTPVWLYGRLRGLHAPRCTGADLFADLEGRLSPSVHRPFFVLSGAETATRLRERLTRRGFPPAALGFAAPPFGFEADEAMSAALADTVRAHGATHLVMALGAPKSEIFVDRWRDRLGDVHALCVGSAPDFLVGVRRRAPPALRSLGLEWLWRTLQEPRRLVRRYFVDSWAFLPAILEDLAAPRGAPPPERRSGPPAGS